MEVKIVNVHRGDPRTGHHDETSGKDKRREYGIFPLSPKKEGSKMKKIKTALSLILFACIMTACQNAGAAKASGDAQNAERMQQEETQTSQSTAEKDCCKDEEKGSCCEDEQEDCCKDEEKEDCCEEEGQNDCCDEEDPEYADVPDCCAE